MPFLIRTTCNGLESYRIYDEMPKLVGPQRFIRETMTRALEIIEISETDAQAGIEWIVENIVPAREMVNFDAN